jgi:cytochrome c oxidase cbb3-type subunit 2
MVERGRKVYTANGCAYCHSQQVRPDYESSDIERKWGTRRSAPRDYIFSRPVLLGTARMGPDLSNIGKRAPADNPAAVAPATSPAASPAAAPATVAPSNPDGSPAPYSAAWHHQHLYAPRSLNLDSNMPAFRFLYEARRISGERSDEALNLIKGDAPPSGWEVVPTFDAKCLVAFLLSLDQSHPLKEVKSSAPPVAPGKAAAK